MKKFNVGLLVLALIVGGVAFTAYAARDGKCPWSGDKRECPLGKKADCGSQSGSECPIASKLMKKAGFYLENSDAIGLTEDQVNQIKAIKMEAKKEMILGGAQMQVAMLEMEAKLKTDPVEVEALNQMIDKNLSEMAAGAKKAIQRYASLKQVLNAEQKAKAKEIWKSGEKSMSHS